MTARNPGPFIHQTPVGFPSFNSKSIKDFAARRAFQESEVNTRVYKGIYESLGIRGRIAVDKSVGVNRIRLRCLHGGKSGGFSRWSQLSRHGFHQIHREGWLLKYVLVTPRMFHDLAAIKSLCHREAGEPPYFNSLWDLPAHSKLHGTLPAHLTYSDKFSHRPIFSSEDQVMYSNSCSGFLQFLKPISKDAIIESAHADGKTIDLIVPQTKWIITHKGSGPNCFLSNQDDSIKVGMKVGGTGPGSDEMKTSADYQQFGPHFVGTLRDGLYCVDPSSVDVSGIRFDNAPLDVTNAIIRKTHPIIR